MSQFESQYHITTIIKDVDDSYSYYTDYPTCRHEGHGFSSAKVAYQVTDAADGEFLVKEVYDVLKRVDQQRIINIPCATCKSENYTVQAFVDPSGDVVAIRLIDDESKRYIITRAGGDRITETRPTELAKYQGTVNFYNTPDMRRLFNNESKEDLQ